MCQGVDQRVQAGLWIVSESVLDAGTETKNSEAGCMQPFLYEERCMFPFLPFPLLFTYQAAITGPGHLCEPGCSGPEYELSAERTLFW